MQLKLISSETKVLDLALELAEQDIIGIDTEFDRRYTYLPIPSLLQISTRDSIWVVDVYKNQLDLSPLKRVWQDANIKKVFHAGCQDIAILNNLLNCTVANIFDTQLASQALGISNQISYEELVAKKIYIKFNNTSQQRSNWLKRPLYKKQIMYAADDVKYLIELYELLQADIEQAQRHDWLQHRHQQLQHSCIFRDAEREWVKYAPCNVGHQCLTRFKQLFIWRELLAVKLNKPTSHLIDNVTLQDLAAGRLQVSQLSNYRFDQDIIAAIPEIIALADDLLISHQEIELLSHRCLSRMQQNYLRQCKKIIKDKAYELGIATNFLINRDELRQFVVLACTNRAEHSPIMNDWRQELFGQQLIAMINQTAPSDQMA